MRSNSFRHLVYACVAALVATGFSAPLGAQTVVRGSIAGKIFDMHTGKPLRGVTIRAHAATANQQLAGAVTDAQGKFQITNAPASVYAFTLRYQGVDFRVLDRLDARAGMTFLLESCFAIDAANRSASLSRDRCDPGIVEEAKVVTLSPQRFFLASDEGSAGSDTGSSAGETEAPPEIVHQPFLCMSANQFPLVRADIEPHPEVKVARVYFRSSKFQDFYYVDMKPTETNFEAVLPKPLPETEQIIYYIEALNKSLNNARTEDYGPQVNDEDECKRMNPAAPSFAGSSPNIVVGATQAGAAAVPPGFVATGIVGFITSAGALSAGGGLGASSLVVIISGAAAATTGIGVAVVNEEEASPPVKK